MDMMKMMEQAKQMQDRMTHMQQELENEEVHGESGGGMVSVVMTCKGIMKSCSISPDIITPDDPSMIEDLVIAAVNDAKAKADHRMTEKTKAMMTSMGLPANIQLPL